MRERLPNESQNLPMRVALLTIEFQNVSRLNFQGQAT